MPAGAVSGPITVTQSSCDVKSAGNFTVLIANSNCGSGATGTDLIISEVYDAFSGALTYIEIFNPTAGTINLSPYNIRFITDNNAITDLPALTGSLASGAVGVVRAATGSGDCGVTTIQTNDAAIGINGNDRIVLRKSGADLDVVDNPSYGGSNPGSGDARRGFSQLRNAGAVTPRSTYQASDWTNTDPESCANLGTAPAAVASRNITINTQPIDVNCSAVTFSVAAIPVGSGVTINATSGYTWRYSAPGDASWSLVSSLNGSNGLTVTGSGSSSITITGNTAILRNYQFYAEISTVGSPSCSRYTNGVQYSYDSQPYYRTRQSGNWTDLNTWEMSNSEGSGYITPVCQYPVSLHCDKVIIQNTHSVTLDVIDADMDWVNVSANSTLTIGNSSLLTVNNGNPSGADFEVNGTLIDNGTAPNGTAFGSGATWSLGSSATIIKTNQSSSSVYRDRYEGGMGTIPATANWIIRYTGASDVSFTTVGSTFYPNLTFENSTVSPYTFVTNFSGGSDFATIKGNLDIGGSTFIQGVTVRNINTNATPLTILGNMFVRAGSTITNTDGTTNGTGFNVRGNVIASGTIKANGSDGNNGRLELTGVSGVQLVQGGGALNINDLTVNNTGDRVELQRNVTVGGAAVFTSGELNVVGNMLSINGTLSRTNGTILLNISHLNFGPNSTPLIIPDGMFTTPVTYRSLTINRVGGVTLGNQSHTLSGVGGFTLTDGVLTTAAGKLLTLGSLTAVTGGSSNSFVNGPLARATDASSGALLFPIGKSLPSPAYKPLTFTVAANGGSTFTGEYFATTPDFTGTYSNLIAAVQNNAYWNLTKSSGSTTGTVALPYTLVANAWRTALGNPLDLTTCNYCNVVVVKKTASNRWEPEGASANNFNTSIPEALDWATPGTTNVVSKVISNFSPFTFGVGFNTILPVSLLSFEGRWQGTDAQLHWQIADTKTLAGFELQHSTDGNR
ncbi:MAG: lamin tail domain-containing protein, partial [Bacteroidetes bacterium]